ncbi:hypothetical protein [Paludibacter sp. 221]|nr:hypothetical protein [Paludibacter sp. 221]
MKTKDEKNKVNIKKDTKGTTHKPTQEEIKEDICMINPDENTLDRG